MPELFISSDLSEKITGINLSCILCDVIVENKNVKLWSLIEKNIFEIASTVKQEEISKLPAIAASRNAYKKCGKDPARYRLSAEALLRRAVKRKELYQVNNVVDLLNLVSIKSGFSIGGYDADKIVGDITMGIGIKDEPYEGIGRGELNIENLPVFRDKYGAFGTPTSDTVRTSVTLDTKRFLMIIIDFGGGELEEATSLAVSYLEEFAHAKEIDIYSAKNG